MSTANEELRRAPLNMLPQLLHFRNVSIAILADNPKCTVPTVRLYLKSMAAKGELRANILT